MTNTRKFSHLFGLATLATLGLAVAQPAHAQISGFSNFTTNGSGGNTGSSNHVTFPTTGTAQLTDSQNSEASSAWYNTKQSINKFTASFTYKDASGLSTYGEGVGNQADGFAFVLQNVGTSALGAAGGSLGYAGGTLGTSASVAVEANLYGYSTTGVGTNGYTDNGTYASPGKFSNFTDPLHFYNGNPINVNVVYNGTTLYEGLTDTVTGATQGYSYTLNIPATLGATTAYVGITAATGGATSTQQFSNFSFVNSTLPVGYTSVTKAGDAVLTVDANGTVNATSSNNSGDGQTANVFDGDPGTKYLNFTGPGSGLIVTPTVGSSIVKGLSLTSANDTPGRDPSHYIIYGSNNGGTTFTQIATGAVTAFTNRFQTQNLLFANSTAFTSYKVIFDQIAGVYNSGTAVNSMQIADISLLTVAAPEPGEIAGMLMGGLGLLGLIARKRRVNA